MAERSVPGEERLARLIFEACEYQPGPDMGRLNRLEQRLNRHAPARRRTPVWARWPGWLILLLAGGAAAAAWWGGLLQHAPEPRRTPLPPAATAPRPEPQRSATGVPPGGKGKEDSHLIYRREDF